MSVTVTYVGTATTIIEFGGLRFITDPVLAPPAEYRLGPVRLRSSIPPAISIDALPPIDAVLLSHDEHVDNLDMAGRQLLRGRPTVTTLPAAGRIGTAATGLAPWESTELVVGEHRVRITATPADHGESGAAVVGFVLQSDTTDSAVYISGDTRLIPELEELRERFRITTAILHLGAALIPVLGSETITFTAEEAARLAVTLDGATIVPVHFEGWDHFTEGAAEVGAAFDEAGVADRLRWLLPGQSAVIEA